MFSDANKVRQAINNLKFHAGDRVLLVEGPHKFARGTFVGLRPDVEWAAIRESNGVESSHPVEWLQSDEKENSTQ